MKITLVTAWSVASIFGLEGIMYKIKCGNKYFKKTNITHIKAPDIAFENFDKYVLDNNVYFYITECYAVSLTECIDSASEFESTELDTIKKLRWFNQIRHKEGKLIYIEA